MEWNFIFFGADKSSSVHVDNKGENILILAQGPTQGLDDTKWTANMHILLILHKQVKNLYYAYTIMETTNSYLLMLQKYIKSKQKTLK